MGKLTSENEALLEKMKAEINEAMKGVQFSFEMDRQKYSEDAKNYVRENSPYQVSDIHFSEDNRILHMTLEPKPIGTIIEVTVDKEG